MQHAITVADILKFMLIGGGILFVLWVLIALLAAYGRGMSR